MAASLLLSAMALAIAYAMFAERVELLRNGRHVEGIVVDIDVGARGMKRVEAEFTAADGRRRIGRDIHVTQWFAASEIGDEVTLYYDPLDVNGSKPDILVERGLWIWLNPAFLLGGGILLLWFGFYLALQRRKRD